jgi:hypothetical protein
MGMAITILPTKMSDFHIVYFSIKEPRPVDLGS